MLAYLKMILSHCWNASDLLDLPQTAQYARCRRCSRRDTRKRRCCEAVGVHCAACATERRRRRSGVMLLGTCAG